jgi:beta-glucanase (GH16 family)
MGTVGNWPQCGEISIMEQWGQDKSGFKAGTQAGGASGDIGYVTYNFSITANPASTFHVYSVDWYPDHLSFQFDGIEFARSTFTPASPFYGIPEYLILSLALGGDQGGTIDNTGFPMDLVIDYVRIYSF